MTAFDFLKNGKHQFYELQENDIINAEERLGFPFPAELRDFYIKIGYGFISSNSNAFNRVMDPDTVADITLREGIYEFDPDLDGIYEEEDQLVFYEVNEGVYITLDLTDTTSTSVYYFETKIADSLEEFLRKVDEDPAYFFDMD
ncbi:SMI1/KNR4 family protein [Gracilibacillus oryzae]|uniref:SMI1/KNR4 family protein n=1 Tax=Gracilibacillus oryzae TaxID=1672701 RepID=A0A7C8GSC3_9BACI|nr:SMI1/KNR4 family protein [Gracilibacillus oryzae]KAB8129171.1 SMI1/KNR4 family protein [Gracilibacillus oryzae]